MQNLRDADLLRRKALREMGSWRSKDEKAVARARELLEAFKLHARALDVRLTPLANAIRAGNEFLVDEVLEFLAVDILAFGCGYAKEKCYRRLKHVELSPSQVGLIKDIALKRCASDEYRREDAELRRLVTKIADLEFLEKISAIPADQGSRVADHKERMMKAVLDGRKDLRDEPKRGVGKT
ncbi:MAG TPA: hypothetical protein VNH19_21185 [Candidatus Limnocylindrales bacterium]|nr:hypothetical protein [Candidatus Limnocylindrales bacterium]